MVHTEYTLLTYPPPTRGKFHSFITDKAEMGHCQDNPLI